MTMPILLVGSTLNCFYSQINLLSALITTLNSGVVILLKVILITFHIAVVDMLHFLAA